MSKKKNTYTYWVAVKTSGVMLRQRIHQNPAAVKSTMKHYGLKLIGESEDLIISVNDKKETIVWVRQHLDRRQIAADCQRLLVK
jgi:hypothetical protein